MKNSRLLILLSSLSKSELKHFQTYAIAESTLIKKKKSTLVLLDVLIPFYPKFLDKKKLGSKGEKIAITKERVFELHQVAMGLKNPISGKTKNHLMSYLVQTLETFIIIHELNYHSIERNILLAYAMKRRNKPTVFKQITNRILSKLEILKLHSVEDNILKLRVLHLQYFHPAFARISKDAQNLLQTLINQLNETWLQAGYRYNTEAKNRSLLFDENFNYLDLIGLEEHISYDFIEKNGSLIRGYRLLHQLIDGKMADAKGILEWYDDIDNIDDKGIEKNYNSSEKEELLFVHSLLVNYHGIHILKGKIDYVYYLFELYKKALHHGYIMESDIINHHHFITIVNLGLSINEDNWVKQFMIDYKNKLPKNTAETTLHFVTLITDFQKGKLASFEKVYHEINRVPEDAFFDILYRVLEIKTLYKLYTFSDEYNTRLQSRLGNFYDLLNNHKIISSKNVIINANQNFIRIVRKLRLFHENKDENRKVHIQQLISEKEFISERAWLTKEINLLS